MAFRVFNDLSVLLKNRAKYECFADGETYFQSFFNIDNSVNQHLLAYTRTSENCKVLVINNLSDKLQLLLNNNLLLPDNLILGDGVSWDDTIFRMEGYAYAWFVF